MAIISGLRRPLTISMVSMSTMKTVFIDIGLSIISTISWFSRSLAIAIATIAIVTMKPFHTTIYITGSMAIARLSLSLSLDHDADQRDGEDGGDGG